MQENIIIGIDELKIIRENNILKHLQEKINNKKIEYAYIICLEELNIKKEISSDNNIHIIELDKKLENTEKLNILEEKLDNKIKQNTIIDITYSGKTLTVLLTILATKNNLKIRNKKHKTVNNIDLKNTTEASYKNIIYYFNQYDYDKALSLVYESQLNKINKKALEKFITYYKHLDNFRYYTPNVNEILESPYLKDIKNEFKANVNATKQFKKKNYEGYSYKIANNITNAQRRIEEGNYQDAILKLYKAIEIIALTRLKNYGIDKYYYTHEQLKQYNIPDNYIKSILEVNSLSVSKQYKLLNLLDDNIGKLFTIYKNKGYDIIHLHIRCLSNNYHPSKEELEIYTNIVHKLAIELNPKMEDYIKYTSFPKI